MQTPNYTMIFSVSQVARALEIDRNLVKKWTYLFREYLKPAANPGKSLTRQFCEKDLRVLSYVYMSWEDDPDVENIKHGLNSEGSYDDKVYNDFITKIMPIFTDLPEEINEDWRHGAVIGGMITLGDAFDLALSYKTAGDYIVETALINDTVPKLICPIINNYRHATELYFKSISPIRKQKHNLSSLFDRFKELLKLKFNTDVPIWFEEVISVFNEFDPGGTKFRYGGDCMGEIWVNVYHLKKKMNWLSEIFKNIKETIEKELSAEPIDKQFQEDNE